MSNLACITVLCYVATMQSINAVAPTQLKGWQLRGSLKVIKEIELNLEEGDDIREMENEVQQNLINEAYFESKLEAARYQDRKEIEYYDDDKIPGVFGDMIEEIAE
ncbi:predicted protein [Chaetoceros tenuissimus]|uniref:Uncharacterized protein n=1 Tax=Chaetoceros tenuissimus TaxID=426638 RepID=A0AAD3D281_9STRA|nr:predicted protein [Chaetoceros tenuissimus]